MFLYSCFMSTYPLLYQKRLKQFFVQRYCRPGNKTAHSIIQRYHCIVLGEGGEGGGGVVIFCFFSKHAFRTPFRALLSFKN